MFDAHCHIQQNADGDGKGIDDVIMRAARAGVRYMAVNGTSEDDWQQVAELAKRHPDRVVANFGVHPWWAGSVRDGWIERLRALLLEYPDAGVGEIGLCKSRRGKAVPMDAQEEVLLAQLRLAKELRRPASIHCVYRHDRLIKLIKTVQSEDDDGKDLRVLIHAYSGGPKCVPKYVDLGACLSFPGGITNERSEDQREALKICPREHLVIETDSPDMLPNTEVLSEKSETYRELAAAASEKTDDGDQPAISNEPSFLKAIVETAAELLEDISPDSLGNLTTRNACRFFGFKCDLAD